MKKIILLAFSLVCVLCHAQSCFDHIVQRGETLELLANKFGVSEQEIRDQNKNFDLEILYVGLPLKIPVQETEGSPEEIDRLIATKSLTNSTLKEANLLYTNGNYQKAAKLYTTALKENVNSDTFFYRGRCYFRQGKYKSAIKDLEFAISGEDLSYYLRTSCESLLTEAQRQRETQLEARGELWGSIFAAAAATAATVAVATTTDSHYYSSSASSPYTSSQGYNLPLELQPEIAAKNAIAQTNYQMKKEEDSFKANYRATFMRNWGREPSDIEVMEAYSNYLKTKNDAYTASNSSSNSSSSSASSATKSTSSTNSSSNTTTSTGKSCLKLSATDYAHCNGSKVCSKCNGHKAYWDNSFGIRHFVDPCVVCGGSGKCPSCGGSGD